MLGAACQGGVAAAVKQRMLLTVERPELELRPMLLFPEVRSFWCCQSSTQIGEIAPHFTIEGVMPFYMPFCMLYMPFYVPFYMPFYMPFCLLFDIRLHMTIQSRQR